MIVVGIDPHKHSHTACAVDGASGVMLGELTVKARRAGHEQLVEWARELGRELLFAVEDVRRCSGGLERFLLERGEAVVRVAPKLMGASRRHERSFGKSDSIDARAVARAALREPDLPRAHLAGIERDIALLLVRREELIAERVRLVGRLRWHLHDLDPDFQIPQAALRNEVWAERAARRLARMQPSVQVRISRDMLRRIRALTKEAQALERELVARVREDAPSLVELPGCGVLTAAKIVAEVAGIERFPPSPSSPPTPASRRSRLRRG